MSGEGTRDTDAWNDGDEQPLETGRLALSDEDDRLPWLESAEDDDYPDAGYDNSGLIRLALIGLVVLAALVGAIWWLSNRTADPELVADGSLVPAEPGPYKVAPADPGGKQFDGTGDSSFAVSAGQNPGAVLEGSAAPATPMPVPGASPAPSAKPAPTASAAPAAPAAGGGTGVQVGAYSSRAAAEAGWTRLVAQANGVLSGVSHRVIEGTADIGTIYRLQAVAGDPAGARALCTRLKAAGIACQVK